MLTFIMMHLFSAPTRFCCEEDKLSAGLNDEYFATNVYLRLTGCWLRGLRLTGTQCTPAPSWNAKIKFTTLMRIMLPSPVSEVTVACQEITMLNPETPGHRGLEALLEMVIMVTSLWNIHWSYLVKRLQIPQRHVIPGRNASRNVETIPHLPTSDQIK